MLGLSRFSFRSHVHEEKLALVSILTSGLSKLPSAEAEKLAFDLAQRWIKTTWSAYKKHGAMFEKVNLQRLRHFSPISGAAITASDSECELFLPFPDSTT